MLVKADNRDGIDPGDLWRWLLDGKATLVLAGASPRTSVELLRRIRASFPDSLLVATLNPAQMKRMTQLTPASAT
ncbi:hypothetical protein [Amycolatopsis pigmentata]|uniref:Uncharacterized protein n=1 Tax=Amycolatopsis pigmentata TaxID=450801 RepID=A0ABW5FTA8_9PSEU